MPRQRRIIHRIEPMRSSPFDEQVWPVHFALFVLGAMTFGLVILAGGWDDPRPLYNGWVRLLTLGITLGGLAWAASTYRPRRARRLQFAVLVSLITHIMLAIFLHHQHLRLFVDHPEETEPPVVETRLPAIAPAPPEMDPAEFERPLETEPIQVVKHAPIEPRTETEPDEAPWHALDLPAIEKVQPPAEIADREPERTRPRRADDLAQFNRRPPAPAQPASRALEQATVADSAAPNPPTPTAAAIPIARHAPTQPAAHQRIETDLPPLPTLAEQPVRPLPADRPDATAAPQPTTRRPATRPADSAAIPGEIAMASQPAESQPLRLPGPNIQITRRTEARSPEVRALPPWAEPPTVADAPDRDTFRADRRPARPVLARSDDPARTRRATEIAPAPNALAIAEQPARQSTDPGGIPMTAQATGMERAAPQIPPEWTAASDTELASELAQSNSGAATRQHARRATEPSIEPRARVGPTPRRALEQAAAPASPMAADSQFVAQNSSTIRPGPAPTALALTRAREGYFAGSSQAANAGQDLPASPNAMAPFPATAAHRDQATQQQAGPALAPAMNAQLAKATSGADAPTAPARAEPLAMAELAGSRRPGELAASASAAIERQFAAAVPGEITASVGHGDLDTGAEQIVPARGSGRSAGGGQPQIQIAAAAPTRRMATGGGAPAASLAADIPAIQPAAPPADGGGAPSPATQRLTSQVSGTGRIAAAAMIDQPQAGGSTAAETFGIQGPTTVRQAERGTAEPGLASGGGTQAPRSRRGLATPAARRADLPAVASLPQSGGMETDPQLVAAANSAEDSLAAHGLPYPIEPETSVPNADTSLAMGHLSARSGVESATHRAARPQTMASHPTGKNYAPTRSTLAADLPNTLAAGLPASPGPMPHQASDSPSAAAHAAEPDPLTYRRQGSDPALNLAVDGLDSGGLGPTVAISSGLPDRLALSQSPMVQSTPTRFVRKRTTGLPTIRGMARKPAPAFAQRAHRGEPSDAAAPEQPPEKTEAAIELGLVYLARQQLADGRWSLSRNGVDLIRAPRERPQLESDAAATGLALLAFLGAGYDHFDDKYQDVVGAGLNFLVQQQKPDGNLYLPGDLASSKYAHFYSHGIAAIALCEAYGMTGDPALRGPAQKAIQFIATTQHPTHGGWRYFPGIGSDLSVTGWQVMALKSGELAGLQVAPQVYERARKFLNQCHGPGENRSQFIYNPHADTEDIRRRHGRQASTVMTSVGLLTSLYLGRNRDDSAIRQGAEHLLANLPMQGTNSRPAVIGTLDNPLRDTYYWYYATQVMFHMKGKYWKQWNARLHPLLIESQTQVGPLAGSWNPFQPVPDQWVTHGGRLYVTTMNLLSLEVYYRHLPLYEATGQ